MMYPRVVRIHKVVEETKDVKTVFFPFDERVEPGQFFMVLIPDVDEIPMSVSYLLDESKGFTFKRVGDATNKLFEKKAGDLIGVRGPLGNGFNIHGEKILFVAGGTGVASVAPAVEKALSQNRETVVALGAKNGEELFFVERLKERGAEVHVATDDGSIGYHGLVSDLMLELVEGDSFDLVVTCGPEQMMKKVVEVCSKKGLDVQASLERHIKCGMGVCGQCCVCGGLRVCVDGPVFDGETLSKCRDFGLFKRDASGKKVYIH
ncbi:MAG: dihydroorotate dehydrogenase electron transfer subunit [Thermoplasmata archaeon]|nr:MAG: dihydroorotate dehydrogenase electron transfer subunit [Thermoplasmata archaeon]